MRPRLLPAVPARPRRVARLALATLPLLAAALLAGCTEPERGEVPPQDAEGRYVIRMTRALTFEPADARVPVGAVVLWVNDSDVEHDVSGHKGHPDFADFAEFGSWQVENTTDGLIPPGGQYAHASPTGGTWTMWCHTHHEERMKGVLRVRG